MMTNFWMTLSNDGDSDFYKKFSCCGRLLCNANVMHGRVCEFYINDVIASNTFDTIYS